MLPTITRTFQNPLVMGLSHLTSQKFTACAHKLRTSYANYKSQIRKCCKRLRKVVLGGRERAYTVEFETLTSVCYKYVEENFIFYISVVQRNRRGHNVYFV
jgi:hypothetical protein